MAEDTATAKPVRIITPAAASLSFAGATTFVVLLTALHLIKPELDPSWHFISEYAIGEYGWIMVLAFLSLALSYVSLFVAIRSQLRTIAGGIGLVLLLVSALGLIIAAIFTTDLHLTPEPAQFLLFLRCESLSLAGVDLVLVYPVPKGAIRDTDLPGDPGDWVLLIGSSDQPDSFSAKLRWVGRVCSWQCSPFRVLFSL